MRKDERNKQTKPVTTKVKQTGDTDKRLFEKDPFDLKDVTLTR